MNAKPEFKKLDKQGLLTLVEWATKEGWNPGLHDAEAFWSTDSDGFYGYFIADEMIGGGSLVSYSGHFGFMGFFIMKPEYRGMGLGRQLWYQRRDLLLSRLQPDAPIGMDGMVAMQDFYAKGGFKLAFKDLRYVRVGEKFDYHQAVTSITEEDFIQLSDYDKSCFGYDRRNFITYWIHLPESSCYKYAVGGEIKGYAVVRKAFIGYKIGPLFANDYGIAEELYKACLSFANKEQVYLDIPLVNESANRLVDKFNATMVFECGRMYYGQPPILPVEKIFGITSYELG